MSIWSTAGMTTGKRLPNLYGSDILRTMNEYPIEEYDVEDTLKDLLSKEDICERVETFEEYGLLTEDLGIVLDTEGRRFQITIKRIG